MVSRTWLGGCCALLTALVCCTAVAEERSQVRTAFLEGNYDNVSSQPPMAPPTPPQPGSLPPSPNGSNHTATTETLPTGSSHPTAAWPADPYPVHGYVDHPMWHWPVIGPLHTRWVTHTKPHLQATHWGYPEYFEERPFGSYTIQAEQMQVVNGLRDQQVLYDYDFLPGDQSDTLSPRGQYQLRKIMRRMECVPMPITVQTTIDDPELDEARRQTVLAALRDAGMTVVPEMVVVDRPPVPGLNGFEGILIYNNLLGQTQDRGGGFSYGGDGGGPSPVNIGNVNISQGGQP
jgi:hypothetical protein